MKKAIKELIESLHWKDDLDKQRFIQSLQMRLDEIKRKDNGNNHRRLKLTPEDE